MFKKAKENKKGFTLAELLIVVAIIAVLVAISIPIFTSQLEKSRDSVTASNVRAAYAEASAAKLTGESSGNATLNTDGTVSVANVEVKGEQTNGAFGAAAAGGTAAKASSFDLPFTLGNGAAAAFDKKGENNITIKFTWDSSDKCTASVGEQIYEHKKLQN